MLDNTISQTEYQIAGEISEDNPEYTTYLQQTARDAAGVHISEAESRILFRFCASDTLHVVKPLLDLLTHEHLQNILITREKDVVIYARLSSHEHAFVGVGETTHAAVVSLMEDIYE